MAKASVQRIVEIVLKIVDETKGTLAKIEGKLQKYEKSLSKTDKTTKQTKASTKQLGDAVQRAGQQATKSASDFKKGATSVEKIGKESKKSQVSLEGFGGSFQAVGAAIAAVAASLALIIFPIKKSAAFQRAMAEVRAISGATAEQLVVLSNRAADLGRTTEYTSIQTASSMKYLAMAGLDVEEIYTAVGSVLQVAQAGAVDLAEAADICTNIMTGFRFTAEDLTHVNDVLVQTFTHTNSSLQELGHAMAYVAPVAAGLGANFEDLTATLGALHNAGMKGSMAGTTLRGMMARLFKPTKQEAELMEKLNERIGGLGLNIREVNGNFVGFVSLVGQLEKAGLDAAEALELFGLRAGPGMAALLGMGAAALKEYVILNEKAEGRAAIIAEIMGENVVGAFRQATSATAGFTNQLGKQLLPATQSVLLSITEIVNAMTDWMKEHEALSSAIIKSVAALVSIMAVLTAFKLISLAIIPMFIALKVAVIGIGKAFIAGIVFIGGWVAAIIALVAIIAGLTFSETVQEWVSDFNVFGRSVEEWCFSAFSEFFQFWAKTKRGFKSLWLDLKEGAGFDVSEERAEIEKQLNKELKLHQSIIDQTVREKEIAKALAELKSLEQRKAKAEQEAINEVTEEYKEKITKAREAWSDVGKKVSSLRTEIENLVATAEKDLSNLATSFTSSISKSFGEIKTSPLIDRFEEDLREIERAYGESGEARKEQARKVENDLAKIRTTIVEKTIKKALVLWDSYRAKEKTLLDAAYKAQTITQREYTNRVSELDKKVLESKKAAFKQATDALKSELKRSLDLEKEFADQIKSIQDDIAAFHKTTEEKIRDLRRKRMTDEAAYFDKVRELQEKLAAAEALAPEQYEEAKALFKEVQSAASGLVGEIKRGDQVVISEAKTIETAIRLLEKADKGLAASGTAMQKETEGRLSSQQEITNNLTESLNKVATQFDILSDKLAKVIEVKINVDTTAIDNAVTKIEGIGDTPGLAEIYTTQKRRLDELAKKLGDLELALVKTQEKAALEVATKFSPEIEEVKARITELGGHVPVVTVEVDTQKVSEAVVEVETIKKELEKPIVIETDPGKVKQAAIEVKAVGEEIAREPIEVEMVLNVVDVEANIKGALEKVRAAGEEITVDLSTVSSREELERLAQEVYKVQQETGKPLYFVGITTGNIEESIDNIGLFKRALAEISEVKFNLEVEVDGEEKVDELVESVKDVVDTEVDVEADVFGTSEVYNLIDAIAKLKDKTVTITKKIVESHRWGGLAGESFAKGGEVPAILHAGEYVLCPEAVRALGVDVCHLLNSRMIQVRDIFRGNGKVKHFAAGGPVGFSLPKGFTDFLEGATDLLKKSLEQIPSIPGMVSMPSVSRGPSVSDSATERYKFTINLGDASLQGFASKSVLERFKSDLRRLDMAGGLV